MFCVTDLHSELSAIQGLLLEGISTAILMLVACAVWDSRNVKNTDSVPIRFGLTVAALALAFGPYTGCSMNPARSLAPALWNNQWSHHWIYWFGPIGGALLSSFMYKTIFGLKNNTQDECAAEAVALNSVNIQKTEVCSLPLCYISIFHFFSYSGSVFFSLIPSLTLCKLLYNLSYAIFVSFPFSYFPFIFNLSRSESILDGRSSFRFLVDLVH